MSPMTSLADSVPKGSMDAIVNGDAHDPFAILGMHRPATYERLRVRVFDPHADAVEVLDSHTGAVVAVLEKLDDRGFFSGPVTDGRTEWFPYRLRITEKGQVREVEDPYRFPPVLGELDCHLLAEGNHLRLYEKLGAHPRIMEGVAGTAFAVWAPNAKRVSVVGPFNNWDGRRHPMRCRIDCGVWEIFLPHVQAGDLYKFEIKAQDGTVLPLKVDPMGVFSEMRPANASVVHGLRPYDWGDEDWIAAREANHGGLAAPMSIYEVHLGSWKRVPEEGNRFLTYRELAADLVPYVKDLGFTHIELMPIHEFPFDGSWGYQPIGLYAPTSRFGTPEDFKFFINACHQAGLGVIIDWVPAHFPTDTHGLAQFDGTHLYEHADPRKGMHMDWSTLIYNFGRTEVRNFLIANALYWIEQFHIDGLRVDAVASMLYLDYSRKEGEWLPNQYGGNENLEAIAFLKRLNEEVYAHGRGAVTLAEESTAWPMVSRPVYLGGLGFGYKWNMGWMHDTLQFFSKDSIHRRWHQNQLTFGLLYAFNENFVLPLSHDEVVHGKGSLFGKMGGDRWQKFANLRAYYAFMWAHPGKKLLFMGGEFAQEGEWDFDSSLDWHLLNHAPHRQILDTVRALNTAYHHLPALWQQDFDHHGFEWIDCQDSENNVLAWLRWGLGEDTAPVAVIGNFTPVVRENYRIGLPSGGRWRVALNTDATAFGGSGVGAVAQVVAEATPWHGKPFSAALTLPPLATLWLVRD